MRAERLGSYSTAATTAGTPVLSRLKSITRYACLWPPPMNREVTRPLLLRPPVPCLGSSSDFSGRCLVMSSRETMVWKRRVGVVGLYNLIGIGLDLRPVRRFLTGLQSHVGLLPVGTKTGESAPAPFFAFKIARAHLVHFHLEKLFNRGFHL